MLTKLLRYSIFIMLALFITASNTNIPDAYAQCNTIGASDEDTDCGYLIDELAVWNNTYNPLLSYPGIILHELNRGGGDFDVQIGFNPSLIGSTTWNNGLSYFTWTFDPVGATNPSLAFTDNLTTHTGRFKVEATTPTDESNFAGKFQLYQTVPVRNLSHPNGSESAFEYDVTTEVEFSLDGTTTFHHNSDQVTCTDPEFDQIQPCYLVRAYREDPAGWTAPYVVESVESPYSLTLTQKYIDPDEQDFSGTGWTLPRACGMSAFNGSFTVEGGRIARASAFEAKTPSVTGGSVYDACGVYIEPIEGSNIVNPFGIYQAGTNDYNYMAGRLVIGEDAAGYLPTNTVVYLDKHYSDSNETYYGGYMTTTQTSSLNFPPDGGAGRYPATLECKYTYDSMDSTYWEYQGVGQDIRAKVIDGRFMVVNRGRINYAAGITGGVDVLPEYQVDDYPGVDSAVGLRGGITLADVPIGGTENQANIKNAACLTTYIHIDGGRVNRLSAVAVHEMGIFKGHIEELTGLGIQPLISGETEATFGEDLKYGGDKVYGIWQEGNEKNLFNGYMIVDTRINESVESRYNYDAKSSIYGSDDPIQIEKLVGYNYDTPDFDPITGASYDIANAYGIFLNPVKNLSNGNYITNSWGLYQEGNDPNYAKGTWEVNTNIDTTSSGDVSSYNATSTVASAADITSYTGFKYTTPNLPDNPNIDNMYGIYLQQICPTVAGSGSIEKYGIYQAGAEQNYLEGPLTINKTSKARAYSLVPHTSTIAEWYQIQLNTESFDERNDFNKTTPPDPPNCTFIASLDGYYQINASVCFSLTSLSDQLQIVIRKNGAAYSLNYGQGLNNNLISLSISDIIPLSVGNTIQLWVYLPRGGITVMPSNTSTYLSIHKIS